MDNQYVHIQHILIYIVPTVTLLNIFSINSSSATYRSVKEVRKKWQDLQGKVKKTAAQDAAAKRLTGGGPPPKPLKQWENLVRYQHVFF